MSEKDLKNVESQQRPAVSVGYVEEETRPKRPWWYSVTEAGSAIQIIIAAALGIAIGLAVTTSVDEVPDAAVAIVGIPGVLWLRALKAVVLPLIVCAMILAIQRLREMSRGGGVLARWTIGYYVLTTLCAVIISIIMVSQVWDGLMTEAGADSLAVAEEDEEEFSEREDVEVHDVVVQMFESLIPANIVDALASDSLLAVLISSIVVGYLIRGPDSPILRATKEVERIITVIITFLIKIAPIGVFFLIVSNLFRLRIEDIGRNLGVLIGGTLSTMAIHLFIVVPLIYTIVLRKNPYVYWFRNAPAWLTAWGSASSAATLPVTLKCARARGIPNLVAKFACPLGALINMDGTAIYFPVVVVFMAVTQGIWLNAADYVIICLLATLASIGTTPIPSSSLVLTVMIAGSVNVPVTGMYAVVVTIDWFLDRFRTALNVSGDLYAAAVVAKITGIQDPDNMDGEVEEVEVHANNSDRV
ncbi:Sodium:dicarboxylate symporter family protein [Lineolata rhizophorae]|uniref:Amino acid transporter n=1 Tax=Lineolata rhizophorae TaxID=578093 RepID=A0A6A6PED8_9PEZI|nr:Sodium:dicarboxylate symporter family protein [Lineolata rhizophorae]